MKGDPVQTRFEKPEDDWLTKMSKKTGIPAVELVRLSVRELRKKYKTSDAVIAAQIASKQEAAA